MAFARSPMDLPIRGALLPLTVSLDDIAKELKEKLIDKIVDSLIDKTFEIAATSLGGGQPEPGGFIARQLESLRNRDPNVEEAEERRDTYIKLLGMYYWPWLQAKFPQLAELERRLEPTIKKADTALLEQIRARAPLFIQNAERLLAVELAGKQQDVGWRVVKKGVKITFEEARRYYSWQGSLIEVRNAAFMSGPNPDKEFIVYVPNRRVKLRGDFSMTVLHEEYQ